MCRDAEGAYTNGIAGTLRFDGRFDRYVVDDVLEGSIDSRKVYVICETSSVADIEQFLDQQVAVNGQVHALDQNLKPDLIVAGEEFFVLSSVDQFSRVDPQ